MEPIEQAISHVLYFDGCSKGNPGPAGAGAVIKQDGIELYHECANLGNKTNNQAEYAALIMGLQMAAQHEIRRLLVRGDSLLVIKQMRKEYKVSNAGLKPLYDLAREHASHFDHIQFEHVFRNENVRADGLANLGLLLSVK
jgi:ribonuclease HI